MTILNRLTSILLLAVYSYAFVPVSYQHGRPLPTALGLKSSSDSNHQHSLSEESAASDDIASRRDFLDLSAATATASFWAISSSATASPANALDSGTGPICVIGANGKTGLQCVLACLDRNLPVRATSRSGVWAGEVASNLLQTTVCDVTQPDTIRSAVKGARAVLFCASASKQGGTAASVDNEGLVATAAACLSEKVPHLVIVSSGGVSKPDSPVYKFLNLFGGIMEQKIRGEDAVRNLYKGAENSALTYTVIRPGGLTEEAPSGVASIELNQGDLVSGRIARADVAALCVESAMYSTLTGGTTYECYTANTGKSLESVGVSNILKQTSDTVVSKTGQERRGDSFEALFTGLQKDA